MDPIEYIAVVRRRWSILLAAVAVGMTIAAAAWVASPVEPSYWAISVVTNRDEGDPSEVVIRAARSTPVLKRVADDVGFSGSLSSLADDVSITADDEEGRVRFAVSSSRGRETATLANAFARAVVDVVNDQKTKDETHQLALVAQRLASLHDELRAVRDEIAESRRGQTKDLLRQRAETFSKIQALGEKQNQLVVRLRNERSLEILRYARAEAQTPSWIANPLAHVSLGAALALLGGLVMAVAVDHFGASRRAPDAGSSATSPVDEVDLASRRPTPTS